MNTEKAARNAEIISLISRMSKAEIARRYGLSRERVAQIERHLTAPRVPEVCRCETCGAEYKRHNNNAGRFCSLACTERDTAHQPWFIAECRRLWGAGLSAQRIAAAMQPLLPGMTKNAVIGIAHRNGFPARPSPIQRRA